MIIKKFLEQVNAFPGNIAIKTGTHSITYRDLNIAANQVGQGIAAAFKKQENTGNPPAVSLLFEHGPDMITGVIAALKSGYIYVPLDVTYPENRLAYMIENSGSFLILTNTTNMALAEKLSGQSKSHIEILNIDLIDKENCPEDDFNREEKCDSPAYILYTSGSTGRPKGVVQTHRNIWYYTRNWIERFSITRRDRMTLFSAFSHDGSIQDMFGALLSGAALFPFNIKANASPEALYSLLKKEEITIWHSVPSLFRFFTNTLTVKDLFYNIRWVLLGGEPLRSNDLELFKAYFPKATLANVYGQTESSVGAICEISHEDSFDNIHLGKPLDETQTILVREDGDILDTMGVGEIVIVSDYIASGYWNDDETTRRVFMQDEDLGRLYWTGDLGRLTAERTIKMMGRKDFQVKIRGFRVETGEIESVLLKKDGIKEAVVTAHKVPTDDYWLYAYYVSNEPFTPGNLREFLSYELPDYMIPRYFVPLESMPLTPNGKIDRNRLPKPEELDIKKLDYEAPTNEIERKVAAIWEEVLGVERVGINDDFTDLGGHSLLVISILSKIHLELNVELQMMDVFDNPTVKQISRLIADSTQSQFISLEPSEEKEYYPATPDQERMYVLNQLERINLTYNLPSLWNVEGVIDSIYFEKIFQVIIDRHEAFRTSFKIVDGDVVQFIREHVDLKLELSDHSSQNVSPEAGIREEIDRFFKPFDLSRPPLLKIGLCKLSNNHQLLMIDTHHIITDGVSINILMKEFWSLYLGEKLPELRITYKDYSEWLNGVINSEKMKSQEEYWNTVFKGEVPRLNLSTDFPRPKLQTFDGDIVIFDLDMETKDRIIQLTKETGSTLFMVLLAFLNILLHKYSSQDDITIGTVNAGRNHIDLENLVGLFVKTIAIRNFPSPYKSFDAFLEELKNNTISSFENQYYPFNLLIDKLNLRTDPGRNPLFDVAFILQNTAALDIEKKTVPGPQPGDIGLKLTRQKFGTEKAMFDLHFEAIEFDDKIRCSIQYNTSLFKRETIELMKERFLVIVKNTLKNKSEKIGNIDISISIEEELYKSEEIEFDL